MNAKIMKLAVAEVSDVSSIEITPETRKRDRMVIDIRFSVAPNPQLAILDPDLDDGAGLRHSAVHARLAAFGGPDRPARQWLAEHGEAVRLDCVEGQAAAASRGGMSREVLQRDAGGPRVKPEDDDGAEGRVGNYGVPCRFRAAAARATLADGDKDVAPWQNSCSG